MLRLLECIATVEQRLVLVAPPHATIPDVFRRVTVDSDRHRKLIHELQAVRGGVYLNGGYLKALDASPNGLHQIPEDDRSWHLLITNARGHVGSCAWYLEHENTTSFRNLRVHKCPLAQHIEWRDLLHSAVETEIGRARRHGLRYAELGGWAVSKERRSSSDGFMLALAAYGLSRVLGGALGITAANATNASSSMLRRLGGSYLEAPGTTLPAYFDPTYNTTVELLRFDSRRPSAKYVHLIELLRSELTRVPVIVRWQPRPDYYRTVATTRMLPSRAS